MKALKHHSRILVSLAVLLVAMGTLPAQTVGSDEQFVAGPRWATKRANVRSGPGTNYDKRFLLEVGDEVQAIAKRDDWLHVIVRYKGPGFVYAPLLTETRPTVRTITLETGSRYRGPTRKGKPHGRGVLTWGKGTRWEGLRYEGDFRDGKRHGRGVYTWADNGTRYEGDFVDNKRHGRGVYTWADGGRYEGQWRNGKPHGHGIRTWANGNRYEGDFRNGERTGRGVYTWVDGGRYEGDFVDSKYHGHGRYTDADGSVQEGEWRDGNLVAAISQSPSAQAPPQPKVPSNDREYWGAYVSAYESLTGDLGRHVYGLTWNAPSMEEAERGAVEGCAKRGGAGCNTHDRTITRFSTSSARDDPAYHTIDVVRRARCIAIGSDLILPDSFVIAVGNTEADAKYNIQRIRAVRPENIRMVRCNDR